MKFRTMRGKMNKKHVIQKRQSISDGDEKEMRLSELNNLKNLVR